MPGLAMPDIFLVCCRWGLSRHFHYVPEILAAFFWTVPALFGHVSLSSFEIHAVSGTSTHCWMIFSFVYSSTVSALFLRAVPYYPSFWPSQKGWWSMSVQVSKHSLHQLPKPSFLSTIIFTPYLVPKKY